MVNVHYTSDPDNARPRVNSMRRIATIIQNINAAEAKRKAAPQKGGNSKLLKRTATALLPPNITTAKKAISVSPSTFLDSASAITDFVSAMFPLNIKSKSK